RADNPAIRAEGIASEGLTPSPSRPAKAMPRSLPAANRSWNCPAWVSLAPQGRIRQSSGVTLIRSSAAGCVQYGPFGHLIGYKFVTMSIKEPHCETPELKTISPRKMGLPLAVIARRQLARS